MLVATIILATASLTAPSAQAQPLEIPKAQPLGSQAAQPAENPAAQPTEILRSGLWSAYSGGDDQRRLCGIATAGGEGRRIAVQQYAGEDGLEIQISKDSWAIPENTPVDLQFQFDGRGATAERATGMGRTLIVRLPMERSVLFMRALRNGRTLRLLFPSGNEPAWNGGLAGTSNVINAFNQCRASLTPPQPAQPTQPFQPGAPAAPADAPPTQPFSAPVPAPTPAPVPLPSPAPSRRG